ncbi:MAG: hypothetical protein RR595_11065 [Lysinibacillus sp.]
MGIFIVIMCVFILVGVVNALNKESSNNESSSKNHYSSSSTDSTVIMTASATEPSQNTNDHNFCDNSSSHSDSSCGSSPSSD